MPGGNESAWFSLFVGVALKSTMVLGVAWLVAMGLRGRSAAAAHLVWTAGSAALLTLPLLSLAIPAVRVPVPGALLPQGVVVRTTALLHAPAGGVAPQGVARAAAANAPAEPAPWRPDWRLWLMLLWAAGFTVTSAQMLSGFAAMRRVRRTAKPFRDPCLPALLAALSIDGEVAVLETCAGRMPASFGLFRPAVLMPADAADWSAERRRVVLLHELAHVRRGDHATHLLARAALSLYWWNPLAWLAWREFLKTRERAADDMVLSAGAAAPDYAGHLLEIARAMQASRAMGWAAVAMARPSQLEGRLLAILDSRRSRKSPGRASVWVAGLVAAAIVVPLAALYAQNAPPPVAFEVASVKSSTPGPFTVLSMKGGPGTGDPGRVTIENFPLESLILEAYDIRTYQITGPGWLIDNFGPTAARFDVSAKIPEGTTKEQFRQMLQNLLAERFKLAVHHETKEMPVYDLVVARGGPKLTPSPKTPPPTADASAAPAGAPKMTLGSDGYPVLPPGTMAIMGGRGRMRAAKESMEKFATWLAAQLHRPVRDATGLAGEYDFTLSWEGDEAAANASGEPTLPEAVQLQLGLKLESKKGRADILVVDHIDKSPTQN